MELSQLINLLTYLSLKDWLAYPGWSDRPIEFCYNFSILKDFSQVVNFPTWIGTVLLFLTHFFLLALIFTLQRLSLYWEFWSCCFRCNWLPFKCKGGCFSSLNTFWLFACWLGVFAVIWETFLVRISWNTVFLLLLLNFCEWV